MLRPTMLYKSRARRCDAETKIGIIMTESKAMQSDAETKLGT